MIGAKRFYLITFFLFICQPLWAFKRPDCQYALSMHEEYIQLIDIAAQNKARRQAIYNEKNKEKRKELIQEQIFEAVDYEAQKVQIYLSMLEKLVQREGRAYDKTAREISRRLRKTLQNHQDLADDIEKEFGTQIQQLDPIMSPEVAEYVYPT